MLQTRITKTAAWKKKLLESQESNLENHLAAVGAAVSLGEAAMRTGNATRALIQTAETLQHARAINPLDWPLQSITTGRFHFLPFVPVSQPHAPGSVAAEIGEVVDDDIRATACMLSQTLCQSLSPPLSVSPTPLAVSLPRLLNLSTPTPSLFLKVLMVFIPTRVRR